MQICVFSLSSSSIDQNLAYSCPLSRMAETRNSLAGDTQAKCSKRYANYGNGQCPLNEKVLLMVYQSSYL